MSIFIQVMNDSIALKSITDRISFKDANKSTSQFHDQPDSVMSSCLSIDLPLQLGPLLREYSRHAIYDLFTETSRLQLSLLLIRRILCFKILSTSSVVPRRAPSPLNEIPAVCLFPREIVRDFGTFDELIS